MNMREPNEQPSGPFWDDPEGKGALRAKVANGRRSFGRDSDSSHGSIVNSVFDHQILQVQLQWVLLWSIFLVLDAASILV